MDMLTRVLARYVYSLDLLDLPLEKLSEQKVKRLRGGARAGTAVGLELPPNPSLVQIIYSNELSSCVIIISAFPRSYLVNARTV